MTVLNPSAKDEFHLLPTFLPDGRHFIYLRISPSEMDVSGVYVGTVDAKPHEQSAQRLMPYEIGIAYAAANDSGPGHLLFLREGTVMAQPFDEKRLALEGTPEPVAERVGSFRDAAFFSVSANGVLVFREANMDSQVVRVRPDRARCRAAPGNRAAFAARLCPRTSRAPSCRARTLRTPPRPICGLSTCPAAAASHGSLLAEAKPSFQSGLATDSALPIR